MNGCVNRAYIWLKITPQGTKYKMILQKKYRGGGAAQRHVAWETVLIYSTPTEGGKKQNKKKQQNNQQPGIAQGQGAWEPS